MATRIFLGTSGTDVNDWNQTDNWSDNTVPVAADDVVFNNTSAPVDVTTNIDQNTIALTSLTITAGFEGTIGNVSTATSDVFLQIRATNVDIGEGAGNGSQRLNLDLGSAAASVINVLGVPNTGADTNLPPLRIKADNVATDIQIAGETSSVGILDEASATGTINDISIIAASSVRIGSGLTLNGEYTQKSGNSVLEDGDGDLIIEGGTIRLEGSTTIDSITQTAGTVTSNTTGTITAYTGRGGTLDLSQSSLARTITTLTSSPNFRSLRDSNVTITNDNYDSDYQSYTVTVT